MCTVILWKLNLGIFVSHPCVNQSFVATFFIAKLSAIVAAWLQILHRRILAAGS